ncbi:MAG: hypothetical protein WCG13_13830 [Burkholderiales bacterium]
MMQEPLKILLFITGIAVTAYLMLTWGKVYWKKRLTLWAQQRGYKLIEYRAAASFEGPGGVLRTENQTAFRVKVRDSDGKTRTGWLVYGRNWNPFSPADELVEEKWD